MLFHLLYPQDPPQVDATPRRRELAESQPDPWLNTFGSLPTSILTWR